MNKLSGLIGSAVALRSTATGIVFLDQSFRYIAVNDAMVSIDGRSRAEHIGKSIAELSPHLWSYIEPILQRTLRNGESFTGEVQSRFEADQRELRTWLLTVHKAIAGDTPILIGLVDDITARKRLEAAVLSNPQAAIMGSTEAGDPRLDELTSQELTILSLLGAGKTTKEVAAALSRSEHTVGTHRKHICAKLGLHSTAELVAFAAKHLVAPVMIPISPGRFVERPELSLAEP